MTSCSRVSGINKPRVLGLTGSIGMGKSTAAAMLREIGVPVHDADAAVHRLMKPDGAAFPEIARAFPEAIADGRIDRAVLGARVFREPSALRRLERILHPLVRAQARRFIRRARLRRVPLVVLDIPLLFETRGERLCDAVAVVSAPGFVQRRRVLSRPGMTQARLGQVYRKQMRDSLKRRRADFVVESGLGRHRTRRRLRQIVVTLAGRT